MDLPDGGILRHEWGTGTIGAGELRRSHRRDGWILPPAVAEYLQSCIARDAGIYPLLRRDCGVELLKIRRTDSGAAKDWGSYDTEIVGDISPNTLDVLRDHLSVVIRSQ